MKTVSHWINGSLTTDKAAQVGEIFNPATGKISGTVNFATGLNILPVEVHRVTALTGTGYLLN